MNLVLYLNGKILPAEQAVTSLFGYRAGSDVVCLQVTEADGVVWHVTRAIYHADILVTHPWWDRSWKCSSGTQSERRCVDKHHCCHQALTGLARCLAGNAVTDLDICPVSSILQMSLGSLASLHNLFQVNLELELKLVIPAKACGSGSTNWGLIWCCHPTVFKAGQWRQANRGCQGVAQGRHALERAWKTYLKCFGFIDLGL